MDTATARATTVGVSSMPRYLTTTGGHITAADKSAAAALAAEYGMGEIAGVESVPAKTKPVIRSGQFAVWDDTAKSARVLGTLATCAGHKYDYPGDGEIVFFGSGKPEPLNQAERKQVRSWLQDAE